MAIILQECNKAESKVCPLCRAGGSESNTSCSLTLRQINATEAIYVCNNPDCDYPVGEEVVVIKRVIPELLPSADENSEMANTMHLLPGETSDSTSTPTFNSSPVLLEGSSGTELVVMGQGHPDSWYDSLVDADVCDWLDSQVSTHS